MFTATAAASTVSMWRFPEMGVLPQFSSIFAWDFPWNKPTSELGVPPFSELETTTVESPTATGQCYSLTQLMITPAVSILLMPRLGLPFWDDRPKHGGFHSLWVNGWRLFVREIFPKMNDCWGYPHDYGNPHVSPKTSGEFVLNVPEPGSTFVISSDK